MEDDDLVDAVEELRPEVLPQRVEHLASDALAQLAGPGRAASAMSWLPMFDVMITTVFLKSTVRPLPSVSRPSSSSCSMHVEHFGVRLLDLVEEHDRVGPAAHRLGQLAGLVVADVSRRRADQPRHGVLLLVLRHVDANHRVLVVEQELGERAGELGLADAGRPEKDERPERPVRILQPGAGAANGVGDRLDRLVLADDALVQPRFHAQQLLDFAFHQPADRNAGPLADDLGDVFLVDFFLEHAAASAAESASCASCSLICAFELRHAAVLQLRRLGVVAGALRALDLEP